MSSTLCFSFCPSRIPSAYQAEFLSRFCQLAFDYETLIGALPAPLVTEEVAVPVPLAAAAAAAGKPERTNSWASLTEEQKTERVATMLAARKAKKAGSLSASDAEALTRDELSLPFLTKEETAERTAMMRKARRAEKKAAAAETA